jgi:hypothetical protein
MPILEAGRPDLAGRDVQSPGDLADEVLGAHAAFFDPEVEEVAAAAWLIGRNLLNLEILGNGTNTTADAWKVGGEQGRVDDR